MNFYDFHIGDYTSRTAHLEPMEDLAYRRMLDLYYTRECALPEDVEQIARLIRMRANVAEIASVLSEFFTLMAGQGWLHAKCEDVISSAQAKRSSAKSSAAARWSKPDANAMRTQCERMPNALPTDCDGNAPSPSPTTQEEKKPASAPWLTVPELVADGVSQNLSVEWLAHRRTRKAKLTRLAWDGFRAEVRKAGWQLDEAIRKAISRNWTAFEAEWVKPAGSTFQAIAAVTVPSVAADKTAELLKADEAHRAEVARQRALRNQERAA